MHMVSELLWAGWLSSAGLGYFPGCFGDKLQYLMIIYSGIVFDCQLVNPPLAVFLFTLYLQVPKGKEEEKKERRCVVFRNKYICTLSILFCNFPFLFIVVIFYYSFQGCNYSFIPEFL
jgi:Na+/pantothenate symporter